MASENPFFSTETQLKIAAISQSISVNERIEAMDIIPWKLRSLDQVDRRFIDLNQGLHIHQILQEVFQHGAPPVVIHLMGFEYLLQELQQHLETQFHGLSVTLGRKNKSQKYMHHVPGNILFPDVWNDIREKIFECGANKAGCILLNGGAGLHPEYITDSVEAYDWITQQSVALLSPHNGVLMAEIPKHIIQTPGFLQWTVDAQSYGWNLSVNIPLRSLRIVKTHDHIYLPSISQYA